MWVRVGHVGNQEARECETQSRNEDERINASTAKHRNDLNKWALKNWSMYRWLGSLGDVHSGFVRKGLRKSFKINCHNVWLIWGYQSLHWQPHRMSRCRGFVNRLPSVAKHMISSRQTSRKLGNKQQLVCPNTEYGCFITNWGMWNIMMNPWCCHFAAVVNLAAARQQRCKFTIPTWQFYVADSLVMHSAPISILIV